MSDRDEFERWFSNNHIKSGETVNLHMKAYMWVGFQAARAQGGQGAEVVHQWREIGETDWMDCSRGWKEKCDGSPEHDTRTLYTQPQPAVPEETEAMVDAAVKVFEDAGARVDLGWLGEACRAYVAASFAPTTPSPEQVKPRNRYGVDASYFHGKLTLILRDMENYTPDELARSLARLVVVADKDVLAESEFSPEQGQAARAQDDDWLIQLRGDYLVTRGIWELAGHRGYTNDISEAGRYSESEAKKAEQDSPEKYKAVRRPTARVQGDGWVRCADRIHAKCGGRVIGRMRDGDSVSCEKCGRAGHVLIDDGGIDIDWTPAGQEGA